jgi:protease II
MGQRATKTILANTEDVETPKMTFSTMEKDFNFGISFKNNLYLVANSEKDSAELYKLENEEKMSHKLIKDFGDKLFPSGAFEHEGKLFIYFKEKGMFSNSFWYTTFDGENFTDLEKKKVIADNCSQSHFIPIFDSETGNKFVLHNLFVSSGMDL